MLAAVFRGPGRLLELEQVPDPAPEAGEVILQVGSCGICGTDLHMTDGHGAIQLPEGSIPGHEYAGEIVALGSGVTRFKVGDRVTALPISGCGSCLPCLTGKSKWCLQRKSMRGGYAQYLRTNASCCIELPADLSLQDGALVEPLAVGLHGVEQASIKVGDRILVIGAGPVGLATLFWARRMGAGPVAVTASSTRRASLALQMGATCFVPPSEQPLETVNEVLGGAPDIVFECVGIPGMLERAIDYVKPRGTVVILGLCAEADRFMPFTAMLKEVRISFAMLYEQRDFHVSIDTLDAGHVEPRAMITDRISLGQTPHMFEALRQRTSQCKVLIDPWRLV